MQLAALKDSAIYCGMNTVDSPKILKDGEAVKLLNSYPGRPNTPVNGSNCMVLPGTSGYSWVPPGITYQVNDTQSVVIWIYDGTYYWPIIIPDNIYNSVAFKKLGYGAWPLSGSIPPFDNLIKISLSKANDYIYSIHSLILDSWLESYYALGNKIIESNGVDSLVREMCISVTPQTVGGTTVIEIGNDSLGVFAIGDYFEYAFTYVRHVIPAAFQAGTPTSGMIMPLGLSGYQPVQVTTHTPGVLEGVDDITQHRLLDIITDGSHTKYYAHINIDGAVSHTEAIAQGATHIRVYRSAREADAVTARGATKKWLIDVPILDTAESYSDVISDAALTDGETYLFEIQNYTNAPFGNTSLYHKARMYIGSNGKWYYSEVPGGAGDFDIKDALTFPQRYASMFKVLDYFIDCESGNGQKSTGTEAIGDDLYLFKEEQTWALFGGDPLSNAPTKISDTIGCAFPNTITNAEVKGYFETCILFMSNEGPMVLTSGGTLRPLSEFKIKELWPEYSAELYSELQKNYDWIIDHCTAKFWDNVWWISYLTKDTKISRVFGYYFNPDIATRSDATRGAFMREFGDISEDID